MHFVCSVRSVNKMKATIVAALLISCALLQLSNAQEPISAKSPGLIRTSLDDAAQSAKAVVRRAKEVPQRAREIAGELTNGAAQVVKNVREIRRPLPVKLIRNVLNKLKDTLRRLRGLLN